MSLESLFKLSLNIRLASEFLFYSKRFIVSRIKIECARLKIKSGSLVENLSVNHIVGSIEDSSSDGSVHDSSFLVFTQLHVSTGSLDVLVALNAIHENVLLSIEDQLLGVKEGIAHLLELLDVLITDLSTILHDHTNL